MDLTESLLNHFKSFSSPPYIFIGSGVARRYLGLEGWEGLLRSQCQAHGLDYEFLNSTAGGDLPELASAMARELHERWWKDEKYKESREQYRKIATNKESALKIEIARHIGESGVITNDPQLVGELELLRKIVVDGIVTTNWDGLLEYLFPDYTVYVGQEALLFSQIQGIGEIYKIHGSHTDPSSLVLTKSDYDEFHRRNPYLASKLLTFFVENPIVFLGYSLTDENILDIIHSIISCLSPANVAKLADRLVFVQWDPNVATDRFERNILSNDGRSLPVYQVTTGSFASVLEALTKIERKIPARILRMLKQQVFELVHTTVPSERLYVQDINDQMDFTKLEFAVGVGIRERLMDKGYTAISRMDLIKDVLLNDGGYKADLILRDTLPEILKRSKNVPVFKYLKTAQGSPGFNVKNFDSRVVAAAKASLVNFIPTNVSRVTAEATKEFAKDFKAYAALYDAETVVNHAALLPEKSLKVTQLQKFLVDNLALASSKKANVVTNFFKLVCVFDCLKYR
ncbi:SIR2 family protein [Caballeronia sp. LZ016]|uniref:SIR2 family protein n=1 Tax=Caballeronia sp. LZ016 TaxID=3038554 RepID=UPI00285E36A0|nr:SIR2 family protein [Caballeronia sp. LZ016]MDR5736597.1 SIR2 family protein [Caballeronia sp. LZ016]